MAGKADTKTRILDAALALFNERGSSNVTTNHVAEALGMSPGNLYYHYRSKEDLVRALFARLDRAWDEGYAVAPHEHVSFSDVARMLHLTFEVMWAYRFFYRETLVLLHNDPDLAARYREVRARGLRDTEALVRHLVASGLLSGPAETDAPNLAVLVRIVADNWLTFRALGGERVDPTDMRAGVDLVLTLLRPYFTAEGREAESRFHFARSEEDAANERALRGLVARPQERGA